MSNGARVWRLRLPASLASVEQLQSQAKEAATSCGFPPDALFRLELALEEALVNVVKYAYEGQSADAWVEVACKAGEAGELIVEVSDGGRPFDPLALPDPSTGLEISEREIGGLGVFLVRKMADTVCYSRIDDQNVLKMTFRRSKEAAGDD